LVDAWHNGLMADLVIRGGLIVDGTGGAPFVGDVAVTGDRIVAVGRVDEIGDREIDGAGLVVTPGFIDIHTHFDGQATWDAVLAPSSLHGVTTLAMGNCGVGFAPARPERHDWLIGLLEGVEDIPGTALAEGMKWGWETFPEYLNVLEAMPRAVDVAAHIPHAALRTYVMDLRGADHNEAPTDEELDTMVAMVREALDAGAIGFATSRTELHKTKAGELIGTLTASERELLALAGALRDAGTGVVQLITDAYQTTDVEFADREVDLIEAFARTSGRPVSFTVQQPYHAPDRFRQLFSRITAMNEAGFDVKAQVAPRPIGVLLGLEATVNPFAFCASYGKLGFLSASERATAMADPSVKTAILAEHGDLLAKAPNGILRQIAGEFENMFELSDPVNYDLDRDRSLAAQAAKTGLDVASMVYDLLLRNDGKQLLYLALFNFASGTFGELTEMLSFPHSLIGLSDAGAHCGAICDASFPTSSLSVWARDRAEGSRFPLETVVHWNTQRNAAHLGWMDRGVLAAGMLADINVIALAELGAAPPEIIHDLPAGGRRLTQRSHGYRHTFKRGVETFTNGVHTGALPGQLVRGTTPAPV
jgi:N-acyl-D-amino-acid deacylase